jgi:hypothetical protein
MDRAEIIEILEREVREARGIAKIQAIKLLLAEQDRDSGSDDPLSELNGGDVVEFRGKSAA